MNNYGMETKEFKEQKSAIKGISFIKSRKAYINVLGINKDIYNSAKKNGIEITDFFVDDSNSRDYDREELTELISFMENSSAEVLVLRNLYEITDNLRALRQEKNLTQLQVVDALEISYCHYARMEQGKRNMSIQMLFALMDFYQTDANTILGIAKGGAA